MSPIERNWCKQNEDVGMQTSTPVRDDDASRRHDVTEESMLVAPASEAIAVMAASFGGAGRGRRLDHGSEAHAQLTSSRHVSVSHTGTLRRRRCTPQQVQR